MQSADGLNLVWQNGTLRPHRIRGLGATLSVVCLLTELGSVLESCHRFAPAFVRSWAQPRWRYKSWACARIFPFRLLARVAHTGPLCRMFALRAARYSLPKLLGSVAPAVRCKSRLAGGGLAGSGKRTTCDDHGDVKAISSLGLCCGLWFARALLVERTPGSDGCAKWNLQSARCCFRPVGMCPHLPPRTTTLVLLIRFHWAGCFLAAGRAVCARAC